MNNSDQNSFDSAAATAYCEECGAKINSSAKFCNQCGFIQTTDTKTDDSITARNGTADSPEGPTAVAGPSEPSAQQSGLVSHQCSDLTSAFVEPNEVGLLPSGWVWRAWCS